MIRINLLGGSGRAQQPHPVGKLRVAIYLKVIVALALAGSPNFWYWRHLHQQEQSAAQQLAAAEQLGARLAGIKFKYVARQREAESLRQRLDVVQRLRLAQTGPAPLLSALGQTVSRTPSVWLNNLKDEPDQVEMQGLASSPEALANLISNLSTSGHFHEVQIKETLQDETVKHLQIFLFTVTCAKRSSAGAGS